MTSKTYDLLKFFAQILLPALGSLYFALAGIWGLPEAEQVVGTIVAVDTFLGVVLQISSTKHANSDARFDGSIDVLGKGDGTNFVLNLPGDPHDIAKAKEILFKVNPPANNEA
ncbi:MAG: phage holin [Ilumatobacteraceae bacterium]